MFYSICVYWLGGVRQHAITWTSVDLDLQRHMASLGPNELIINDNSEAANIALLQYSGNNPIW